MTKHAIRTRLRTARDAYVASKAPAIAVPEEYTARLRPDLVVASYIPLGSEADPAPLVAAARAAGARLVLPHVIDRATPLRFLAWDENGAVETGPFGLRQPPAAAPALDPDIILTPLLGFDTARNRLGQGAGHYDRAFARYPDAWRLGIAFAMQRIDALPADPWDVPLHRIATERGAL